jgi:hypothetical protein
MTKMNQNEPSSYEVNLKKYYVYALIDSRRINEEDQGIFYIGKGTNKRIEAHVRGVKSQNNDFATSEEENDVGDSRERLEDEREKSSKERRIKEVLDSGGKVLERIIGRFDTSHEAFAVEATLIEWVYGREKLGGHLTNIQSGHGSKHIRRKGDFEMTPWLDLKMKFKMECNNNPMRYSENALERLNINNIFEISEETVERLRAMIDGDDALKGLVTIDDPFVVESGRYLAAIVNFGEKDVILRLQFTPTSLVTNLRARKENKKESRDAFSIRMHEKGLTTKNRGSYGWIEGWSGNSLAFHEYNEILGRIKTAFKRFND